MKRNLTERDPKGLFAGRVRPTNANAPVILRTRSGRRTDAERTHWPRLGGIREEEVAPRDDFGDRWFIENYEPGDEAVGYVAGCVMLRERASAYHLPLAKAGWSQLPNLLDRQADLNSDRYAGWRRVDGELVEVPGCHWEMQRTVLGHALHPRSCVECGERGIRVRLPRGYRFQAFEKDMHRAMSRASLASFARSEAGRVHFGKLGIDPAAVAHFTCYKFGSGTRIDPANEIYIMRPRQDFSRIAMIAEDLVLAFVRARAATKDPAACGGNVVQLHR